MVKIQSAQKSKNVLGIGLGLGLLFSSRGLAITETTPRCANPSRQTIIMLKLKIAQSSLRKLKTIAKV